MRILRTMTIAACLLGLAVAPAMAGHDENPSPRVAQYTYDVAEVFHPATDANDDVTGTVRLLALPENRVQVKVRVSGVSPGLPHAQHLHGVLGGSNACPTPEDGFDDDITDDGFTETLEAAPAYGGVQVSLTTSGDTSGASALTVGRMPVADADGTLSYDRSFVVPEDVWASLGSLHYVVHGIDVGSSGAYDINDQIGESPLAIALGLDDLDIPFEATIPAGCAGIGT